MALSINTNIQAMNAQRHLEESQSMLSRSMERLSSGLRINSAKDDSAGLAITDRMNAQVQGLNQAVRNANDGISLAQTAEGATQEVMNLLQDMREIAVQASNETYSASDRASMQDEVDQLYEEINRIAETTQFNGINLLDGTGGTRTFQVGANSNQTLELSLQSVKSEDLNLNGYSELGELNGGRVGQNSISADEMMINDVLLDTASDNAADSSGVSASEKAEWINSFTDETSVTAEAYNVLTGKSGVNGIVTADDVAINGQSLSASGSMTELVKNINNEVTGVTASLKSDGSLKLSNETGETITVEGSGTISATGLTAGTYGGFISLSSSDNSEIELELATDFTSGPTGNIQELGFNASTGSDDITSGAVNSTAIATTDLITINGVRIGESATSSAGDKAAAINAVTEQTNIQATASTEVEGSNASGEMDSLLEITGNSAGVGGGADSGVTIGDDLVINGTSISLTNSYSGGGAVDAQLLTDINNVSTTTGVVAGTNAAGQLVLSTKTGSEEFFGQDITLENGTNGDWAGLGFETGTTYADQLKINGVDILSDYAATSYDSEIEDVDTLVQAINSANAGVVADTNEEGHVVLTSNSGMDITIEANTGGVTHSGLASDSATTSSLGETVTRGTIELTSENGADIIVGSDLTTLSEREDAIAKLGLVAQGGSSEAIGTGLSVATVQNANNAIERIDDAINNVDSFRGEMGAIQNRLESTISNLSNISENLSSARSRILDADIAQETSMMTKANILQQAGVSILAQANQSPQIALSLLQG
jgi:flagellin